MMRKWITANVSDARCRFVRRIGNRVFSRLIRCIKGWTVRDSQLCILAVSRSYLSIFRLPEHYNYIQQSLIEAAWLIGYISPGVPGILTAPLCRRLVNF